MKKLEKKVAVITGGISGIGLASSLLFKKEGATVVVNARNENRLEEAKIQFDGKFDKIIKADISKVEEIENLYKDVHENFGKIDILFLNAGVGKMYPLEAIDERTFDEIVNTNFKGVFFGIQKALPYLKDKASIIVTTSVTNQMADPFTTVYAGTKSAVASLVKTTAMSLNQRGIRINALSPGPVDTPIFGKAGIPDDQIAGMKEMLKDKIPLGRIGSVEELAKSALFLASEDSSFMTGSELVNDGGYSL